VIETELNPDETLMSTTDAPKPTKTARGKKATKAKKATGKPKERGVKTRQEESQIASSFVEPEDDDFEVKVAPSPVLGINGKKRKSEDISTMNDNQSTSEANVENLQSQAPKKRQRRTRASSSVAQAQEVVIPPSPQEVEADTLMTDAEEMPPPSAPVSKKKGKGGKKRASSTTRKASSASAASKASLRANVPADEDIEAALEAELNQPLTDEEGDPDPVIIEQPKGRRLTRNRPGSKKATASVAPTRRGTRASSADNVETPAVDGNPPVQSVSIDEHEPWRENQSDVRHVEIAKVSPEAKKTTSKLSPEPPGQQEILEDNDEASQETTAIVDVGKAQESSPTVKSQRSKGRQKSRQLLARNTQESNMSTASDTMDLAPDVNSSMLDTQTVQDDSGHETDASVIKQSRTKRGGKKAPARKVKGGKKAAPMSRNIEDVVHAPATSVQASENNNEAPDVASDRTQNAEPNVSEPNLLEEPVEETKAKKQPKGKGKASKTKDAAKDVPVAAPEDPPDAVMTIQESPVSLPSPSFHSTPRPALSPQSSDAENQPPSSRPSSFRPPLSTQSIPRSQMTKVPLAVTPTASPSKGSFAKLQSILPWTAVDLEHIFHGTPSANKENDPFVFGSTTGEDRGDLTSPEKKLTVEKWIQFNAQRGEEKLRNECERLVGKFEGEGVRALRTLEGIVCAQ